MQDWRTVPDLKEIKEREIKEQRLNADPGLDSV